MASLDHGARFCVFGCRPEADDSLEHYCRCDFLRRFATGYCGLKVSDIGIHDFFLLRASISDEVLTRLSVLHYCAFSYFLMVKHGAAGAGSLSAPERFNCMRRLIFKAVKGHPRSRRLLDRQGAPIPGPPVQTRPSRRRRLTPPRFWPPSACP